MTTINAPVAPPLVENPTSSTRYALVSSLLSGETPYRNFPEPLESEFRLALALQSAAAFRSAVFYILLLYLGLGAGILAIFPGEIFSYWPFGYTALGLVVISGIFLSRIPSLDGWFTLYGTFLAYGGVALTFTLSALSHDPKMQLGSMIGVMPALIVVGGMLGLRFIPVGISIVTGGTTGLLLHMVLGVALDWLMLAQTFGTGSLVALLLAWLTERRDRQAFLQRTLLAMEKQRSDALASRMQEISRQDGLTGLANRRYFDEMLEREWLRCQRDGSALSLMFIDVDFFKPYNDFYGHQAGDDCLQKVAAVLADHTRRPGDLAARYGGEEFVLLYPQTGPEAAQTLAEKVRASIAAEKLPHQKSSVAKYVTVSIGLATMLPEDRHNPGDLVRRADHQVYRAKEEGRNRVCGGPEDQL